MSERLIAALPAMTAELAAALREWRETRKGRTYTDPVFRHACLRLAVACDETPGLLPAPPSTAPLPAMWCGKDAFEGEG